MLCVLCGSNDGDYDVIGFSLYSYTVISTYSTSLFSVCMTSLCSLFTVSILFSLYTMSFAFCSVNRPSMCKTSPWFMCRESLFSLCIWTSLDLCVKCHSNLWAYNVTELLSLYSVTLFCAQCHSVLCTVSF